MLKLRHNTILLTHCYFCLDIAHCYSDLVYYTILKSPKLNISIKMFFVLVIFFFKEEAYVSVLKVYFIYLKLVIFTTFKN